MEICTDAVSDAESKCSAERNIVDAIKRQIVKARQAIKEAQRQVSIAREIFERAVSKAEDEMIFSTIEKTVKRGYLAARETIGQDQVNFILKITY